MSLITGATFRFIKFKICQGLSRSSWFNFCYLAETLSVLHILDDELKLAWIICEDILVFLFT